MAIKRTFITYSTGEVEVAIQCLLNGVDGEILDFSSNHCSQRNRELISAFREVKYRRVVHATRRIRILVALIRGSLALSANSYSANGVRAVIQRIFNVYFFRDSIIPRAVDTRIENLLVEPSNAAKYPASSLIFTSDRVDYLKRVFHYFNRERRGLYDALIIGKGMRRTTSGPRLKKGIYSLITKRFNRVAILPHPRESDEELKLAADSGLIIVDNTIYQCIASSEVIFVVCGSAAETLDLLNIHYYYIDFDEEFRYKDNSRLRRLKCVRSVFSSLLELEAYDFKKHFC